MARSALNTSPRYWSCDRKRRYTRNGAQEAIRDAAVRGMTLFLYRCPYSGLMMSFHWHLTKEPQS
jgi:hypothetical protein